MPRTREEIDADIRQLIAEDLDVAPDSIKDSSSIVADLGANSLDVIQLVMAIEALYDIEVPDNDAEKLVTVEKLVDYLESRLP